MTLRHRLYLNAPTFRSNQGIEAVQEPVRTILLFKQQEYRQASIHQRSMGALQVACREARSAHLEESRRERKRAQEKTDRAEAKRRRQAKLRRRARKAAVISSRKKNLDLVQRKRVRQGNVHDLRKYLRQHDRTTDEMVDYSALDGNTRMAFYPRRRTNNSASTVCDVMSREKWKKIKKGSQHGQLSDFIV